MRTAFLRFLSTLLLLVFALSNAAYSNRTQYATYTNAPLGIEFKYPKTWKRFPLKSHSGRNSVIWVPPEGSQNSHSSISLDLALNSKNLDLVNYLAGYSSMYKLETSVVKEGEIQAVKVSHTKHIPHAVYYFTRPNSRTPVFELGISGVALSFQKDVIKSIHFIEPDGSTTPESYTDYAVMYESAQGLETLEK